MLQIIKSTKRSTGLRKVTLIYCTTWLQITFGYEVSVSCYDKSPMKLFISSNDCDLPLKFLRLFQPNDSVETFEFLSTGIARTAIFYWPQIGSLRQLVTHNCHLKVSHRISLVCTFGYELFSIRCQKCWKLMRPSVAVIFTIRNCTIRLWEYKSIFSLYTSIMSRYQWTLLKLNNCHMRLQLHKKSASAYSYNSNGWRLWTITVSKVNFCFRFSK